MRIGKIYLWLGMPLGWMICIGMWSWARERASTGLLTMTDKSIIVRLHLMLNMPVEWLTHMLLKTYIVSEVSMVPLVLLALYWEIIGIMVWWCVLFCVRNLMHILIRNKTKCWFEIFFCVRNLEICILREVKCWIGQMIPRHCVMNRLRIAQQRKYRVK